MAMSSAQVVHSKYKIGQRHSCSSANEVLEEK